MSNGEALVEAFLIVDQPRQRLGHWTQALSALDDRAAPPLALVRGYYDPSTDQALINVAYDAFALGVHLGQGYHLGRPEVVAAHVFGRHPAGRTTA